MTSTRYNIDPELAEALAGVADVDQTDIIAARAKLDEIYCTANRAPRPAGISVWEDVAQGEGPPVRLRIYQAAERERGALLYIHGGGFVLGNLESVDFECVEIAAATGLTVVSVDYRLAPESPFPAALQDCYAGLAWLHRNADRLEVDPDRIGLFGSSAGGNLAAATAIKARDLGQLPICFQFLRVPVLDDRCDTASMRRFVDTPWWDQRRAISCWQAYLGPELAAGSDAVGPYAAPAREIRLEGLPKAYISVVEFDPGRDEAILYAIALMGAGVSVELHCFAGAFHGSRLLRGAAISQREDREMMAALMRGMA